MSTTNEAVQRVRWFEYPGGQPRPADPAYPNGRDVDQSDGAERTCTVALPYPAQSRGYRGHYNVRCSACRVMVWVAATGQRDDPKSVRIACREMPGKNAL